MNEEVSNDTSKHVITGPLPKTLAELRQGKPARIVSIKAAMRPHYDALYDDATEKGEQFRRLLNGVTNSESVEGTTRLDDAWAANMIREDAREKGNQIVGTQNLDTLVSRLRALMDDDGIGRKSRREAGEAEDDKTEE
jgi:hypothetical protein